MKQFVEITCPVWGPDAKMFKELIKSGFEKSVFKEDKNHNIVAGSFQTVQHRLVLNFYRHELPTLVDKLRALETEEADLWADDICAIEEYPK